MNGEQLHEWLRALQSFPRSITGDGVRQTLAYVDALLGGGLAVHEIASGTRVFDWTIPREWECSDAWIEDPDGRRIVDLADSRLHVIGYSTPIDAVVSLEELDEHLYSEASQPNVIPYVTSYYDERWGFCVTDRLRGNLRNGPYRVHIDSRFKDGFLTLGELVLPGSIDQEVLVSTYVCHPEMANDNLSGIVVATALAKWLDGIDRRLTYRFVFVPETIGALAYLDFWQDRSAVIAGFVMSCVGDERGYSLVHSGHGDTLADRIAEHVLSRRYGYRGYSFLARGSDERQYCAPGIDLPVVAICRSKFDEFPEYHTSADDASLVTPTGLQGSLEAMQQIITALERNRCYQAVCVGEPQLGRRGLYPTLSRKTSAQSVRITMDVLAYVDGCDLLTIAGRIGRPVWELYPIVDNLLKANLIKEVI